MICSIFLLKIEFYCVMQSIWNYKTVNSEFQARADRIKCQCSNLDFEVLLINFTKKNYSWRRGNYKVLIYIVQFILSHTYLCGVIICCLYFVSVIIPHNCRLQSCQRVLILNKVPSGVYIRRGNYIHYLGNVLIIIFPLLKSPVKYFSRNVSLSKQE